MTTEPARESDSREREGMFCISNITYSDGRWERPYYTMSREAAYRYLGFLMRGGWRGVHFEQFRDGQWHDLSSEANAEFDAHSDPSERED